MSKTALVTGSTSGIGLGIAKVLASKHYNIVLHGLLDQEQGQRLADQMAAEFNIKVMFSNANMANEADIIELINQANNTFSGIDILVNNAGIQHTDSIEQFPMEKWHAIMAINLTSAFVTTQQCLPYMQKNNWGRVINIASVHGLVASVNKSAYVAAKHGLVGLTKVTAIENANKGITANAICPGWVETPLINNQIEAIANQKQVSFEEAKQQLISAKQPRLTMATPEQIGELVAFLCTDSAQGITGTSMPIDGAWTAQ